MILIGYRHGLRASDGLIENLSVSLLGGVQPDTMRKDLRRRQVLAGAN